MRPETDSRWLRVWVERGSMLYSAVTHPWVVPRKKPGWRSSTLTAQSTTVLPRLISTDPSAKSRYPG